VVTVGEGEAEAEALTVGETGASMAAAGRMAAPILTVQKADARAAATELRADPMAGIRVADRLMAARRHVATRDEPPMARDIRMAAGRRIIVLRSTTANGIRLRTRAVRRVQAVRRVRLEAAPKARPTQVSRLAMTDSPMPTGILSIPLASGPLGSPALDRITVGVVMAVVAIGAAAMAGAEVGALA